MKFDIRVPVPKFECSKAIAPYLQSVFEGEYDVPLDHPAPIILDLGANFGAFSIWASHRWSRSTVYAYEPNPKIYDTLVRNVENYSVYCCNWGIGAEGTRILYDGQSNEGESSFHILQNNKKLTGVHCDVRDPLSMPEANILKMDIEGCEIEVLEPLITAGREFDAIMFEYHHRKIRQELEKLLEDYTLTGSHIYEPDRGVMRYVRSNKI